MPKKTIDLTLQDFYERLSFNCNHELALYKKALRLKKFGIGYGIFKPALIFQPASDIIAQSLELPDKKDQPVAKE